MTSDADLFLICGSDMDLHMTALALELCCTIMVDRKSIQNVGLAVRDKVLPQALVLIRSALLQGQALQVPPPTHKKERI
jgi:cullin-associated NEDD8-dissociated protein 1